MYTLLCLSALVLAVHGAPSLKDRARHPLAPSLPQLTEAEEAKLEAVVNRFIDYDIGKLTGAEGKRAIEDFNRLGPEAIFVLIDGFNRAANMQASCPAVVLSKKIASILVASEDYQLLTFAKESIGVGVKGARHQGTLKDLQFAVTLRRTAVQRLGANRPPASMPLADLAKAAAKESGVKLQAILTEAEKRQGPQAVDILVMGLANPDAQIVKLSQGLLSKHVQRKSADRLKELLKHDDTEVRIEATRAIGGNKKTKLVPELIAAIQDAEPRVQQAARQALMRISGRDHGPGPAASFGERETAMQQWRDWWKTQ